MTETQDVGQVLGEVENLKRRSRRYRDSEELERAAEALQRAVGLIEPLMNSYEVSDNAEKLASQDMRDLAVQLADCYGSLGGIRRRQGDFQAALELYAKGRQLEQTNFFGINATYNQVQWLILRILLNPQVIRERDPAFLGEISYTLGVFDERIAKNPQDPWLRSDQGLLQTLLGDQWRARRSWEELDARNPTPNVYKSALLLLQTLADALSEHRGLRDAVEYFQARVNSQ